MAFLSERQRHVVEEGERIFSTLIFSIEQNERDLTGGMDWTLLQSLRPAASRTTPTSESIAWVPCLGWRCLALPVPGWCVCG